MKRNTFRQFWRTAAAGGLALSLCLSSCPVTAYAAAWGRAGAGTVWQMADGTLINGAIARGIDVSYWQQEIDWNQVAQDDVEFVMLGTRFRGAVDPYFQANAAGAHAAGIKLGAYIYSYATSVEMAEQEADFVLELIKDFPISYPVAFDAEDSGTLGTLSPSEVSAVINAFCKKIEDAGYHPMVYANENWLNNKIDLSMIDYDIWVARYNTMYTYSNPSMWQATSTGSVSGIDGNVDINFLFSDYSQILPSDTWRTIGGNTYYYKNHLMQKNAWIHDGTGWFYMNQDGSPAKGWMTMPDGQYYLDETTGKMAVNWKQLDGSWYYFKDSGVMATGWEQAGDSWYYLAQDGRMQTGWLDEGGKRYYLSGLGAMSTGAKSMDGASYYFYPSGELATGWMQVDGNWYYANQAGQLQTGWQQVNGSWYFLNQAGVMQTGWQTVNESRYYMNGSGVMLTGWQQIGGAWYYLAQDGRMLTGWQEIDGALYHLDEATGQMAANAELELNGVRYQADAGGVCTPVTEAAAETGAGMNVEQTAPGAVGTEAAADGAGGGEGYQSGGTQAEAEVHMVAPRV